MRSPGLILALGACLLVPACGRSRPGTPPRHVLLITVDTLRADHLSFMGYPRLTSFIERRPEQIAAGEDVCLDDLAAQGVVFARAYAPRGQTAPSMASLFTGRPPLEHGLLANGERLGEDLETLPELFQRAGFLTAAFTSNKLLVPGSGFEQGFEFFHQPPDPPAGPLTQSQRDLAMVGAAVQWMHAQDYAGGRPIFLWLHFMGPHLPYTPEKIGQGPGATDFATLFADPDYDGPANGTREFLDAAYAEGRELTGLDIERVVALYDGEVARVGQLVDRFMQEYVGLFDDAPDRLEDSVLVFASDHGEELYQRNRYWAHSKSVYDSVLHVPLFIRHKNSLTGMRYLGEEVELQDVLPTLLEFFDLDRPAGVRGRSLLALTDIGAQEDWDSRPSFAGWRDRIFTVRTPRWRLVWNGDGLEPDDPPAGPYAIPRLALYDLERDPQERWDVSGAHPEVVDELARELQAWLDSLELHERLAAPQGVVQGVQNLGYGASGGGNSRLPVVHDGEGVVVGP